MELALEETHFSLIKVVTPLKEGKGQLVIAMP